MKLNAKFFSKCQSEPFETQTLDDGSTLEMHYLDDNPFFDSVINDGQFALWTTQDGNVWKILVEKGYYQLTKDFYCVRINGFWTEYYAACDKAQKDFFRKVMWPITIVYTIVTVLVALLITNTSGSNAATTTMIVMLVVFAMFSYFLTKRVLKRKLSLMKQNVYARIKKYYGAKNFSNLVVSQRKYCQKYFAKRNKLEEMKKNEETKKEEPLNPIEEPKEIEEIKENENDK